jgi:hypothetical protein
MSHITIYQSESDTIEVCLYKNHETVCQPYVQVARQTLAEITR